jgi:hypothetical protein
MPTSAIIPLHLILCTNIFNGYSESPIGLDAGSLVFIVFATVYLSIITICLCQQQDKMCH